MDEPPVSDLLTVAQAIEIIDAAAVRPRALRVALRDADGLVLAQDLLADRDYPPFDKSQMDGYAVRAADVTEARAALRCLGEIAAGSEARFALDAGQAVAIMTGAPMPAGADAVVPVEDRIASSADSVELRGPAVAGRFIAPRGSDCRAAAVVLRRGQRLGPAQLAVAATVGARDVDVYARPRAAVLTTGDEIVAPDQSPRAHQIRNSNSIMLVSLLRRLGAEATDLGIVRDDPALIRDAIARAIDQFDVLLITGGMSMGEHDYVPRVLRELGVELRITKLRIKPGKPFVFGIRGAGAHDDERAARYVFGLPGNPVSGFACTMRLCARLLARIAGEVPVERWVRAMLESDLGPNGPREFYQPAVLTRGRAPERGPTVRPLQWKSSGDVFTLAHANCLLVRPEHDPARSAGTPVDTLELPP